MNCQEITTRITQIKTKKVEFDGVEKKDIPRALELKKEIQLLIKQLKEIIPSYFTIEGKEFPVFKLEIGGKTAEELENELLSKNYKINYNAEDMLHSPDFITSSTAEQIDLVRLKVGDLGFPKGATQDEIFAKAQELGLELCPAEVGPYQRLKDADQPISDFYRLAMKQISDRHGNPKLFLLYHNVDGLWLGNDIATPGSRCFADIEFVFRVPTK